MSKLWLMYDKKDRMVQRVTKNIRHRIKYLTQTSFLAHENKIKSYSSCLCAFMGLIPVVTALSHNSNCVFTYYITFISVTIIIITDYYLFLPSYGVVQLVETLRYKPEGRLFDSRWCHWNLSLT